MRAVTLLFILLLSNATLAAGWQREDSPVTPALIKIADEPDAAPAVKPAGAFQIRGFYIGMTLGQFNQQMLREFGQEIDGFIHSESGFFAAEFGKCEMSGGAAGATDEQMTALAKFPGVQMKQVNGKTIAYDVKGSGAVSVVKNVLMSSITFSACDFGFDDHSSKIFEAVEALRPLPDSCRQMTPFSQGEQSFCYVGGNLFSFKHYNSTGSYSFWMMDPVRWGPRAAAAGVKPP